MRAHPSIDSVWLLGDGAPRFGLMGALHGNEVAGLRVIERLVATPDTLEPRLRGSLALIIGNPRAADEGRRYSAGGTDINRLFGFDYVEELAREAWTYEHHRAAALRPLLAELDALLDLHSASQPTVPFAVCDRAPSAVALARRTGCRVTYGWDGPGMLMDHVSIGSFVRAGKPALSVECGQHADPDAIDVAWTVTERFLAAVGAIEGDATPFEEPAYEIFGRVVKPTVEFRLARDFGSFDRLGAGAILGSGDGVTITLDRDAHLILPTPRAQRGEDIVYLARRDGA